MEKTDAIINAVVQQIIQQRETGDIELPTESKLAEQYQTSRSNVREALKILQHFNMIKSIRGSGYSIVEETDANFSETVKKILDLNLYRFTYEEISQLRQALEIQVVSLIQAYPIRDEDIKYLEQCVEEMKQGKDIATEADQKFHRKLADMSRNRLIFAITDAISQYSYRYIDAFWGSEDVLQEERKQKMVQSHERIITELVNKQIIKISDNAIVNHYRVSDTFLKRAYQMKYEKGSDEKKVSVRAFISDCLQNGWKKEEIEKLLNEEVEKRKEA